VKTGSVTRVVRIADVKRLTKNERGDSLTVVLWPRKNVPFRREFDRFRPFYRVDREISVAESRIRSAKES